MRVLYITNMYPQKSNDYYGIFVKEQVDCLQKFHGIIPDIYFINGQKRGYRAYLLSIFAINWKLLTKKYDAVHVHYGLSGLFLFFNFWFPKKKLFLTLHGGDINKEQKKWIQVLITKKIIKKFNVVFAINEFIAEEIKKNKGTSIYAPCGVDTDFFYPVERPLNVNKSVFNVIFPSSPTRWVKNYPFFKEIIQMVEKQHNLEVKEILFENCSREQIRDNLQLADCLFLTSFSEGSPQVIKEAIACNLPVVSTNVGDVQYLLSGLRNCYVYDIDDKEKFVKALYELSKLKDARENIRQIIYEKGLDQINICKNIYLAYQASLKS